MKFVLNSFAKKFFALICVFVFVGSVFVLSFLLSSKNVLGQTSGVAWTWEQSDVSSMLSTSDLAIDSTGIFTAGTFGTMGPGWYVEKRNKNDGGLFVGSDTAHSPAFGSGGAVIVNSSGTTSGPLIAVDSSYLYLAVRNLYASIQYAEWRIEKRDLATGELVPGFGMGGVLLMPESTSANTGGSIIFFGLDPSGLYIGGQKSNEWGLYIYKRNPNTGAPVAGFGIGGVSLINENNYIPVYATAGPTGIYVSWNRYYTSSPNDQRLSRIDLNTGATDSSFGTGGSVFFGGQYTGSFTAPDPAINTSFYGPFYIMSGPLKADSMALYQIEGIQEGVAFAKIGWRLAKRNLQTGALITSFGVNGFTGARVTYGGLWMNQVFNGARIAVDSTGIYVAYMPMAQINSQNDVVWVAEKRDLNTGALVPGFGTGGVVFENPGVYAGWEAPLGVAADCSGVYWSGVYWRDFGSGSWGHRRRLEKINNTCSCGIDIGLRLQETGGTVKIGGSSNLADSPLHIQTPAGTRSVLLVDKTDSNASQARFTLPSGIVKALKKCP